MIMKILIYNWVPFDDAAQRGGGVTLYLYHLMEELVKFPDIQCTFLSSGLEYTFDGKIQIQEVPCKYPEQVRSYQIVNSPVHAPASVQFHDLKTYLEDTSLLHAIADFITQQGGFDVIHFHNLEGLSLSVLKLKELFPGTQMYYTLHNYFLFCPQVNLWNHLDQNCFSQPIFPHCVQCVKTPDGHVEGFISSLRRGLYRFGISSDSAVFRSMKAIAGMVRKVSVSLRAIQSTVTTPAEKDTNCIYQQYRSQNITFANRYFDKVLAVSQKVANIAQFYGIQSEKLVVDYIGTPIASTPTAHKKRIHKSIRIGYLGYARADKGFDFFLSVLEALPDTVAAKLQIVLAAKCDSDSDRSQYEFRIAKLSNRFASIHFQNGYQKEYQQRIMSELDLGIVPVLWEDNLPQVAIEYIAAGVPILVSDCGGAQELLTNPDFVFRNGNVQDVVKKIISIVEKPEVLLSFWSIPPKLTTMDNHLHNLISLYTQGS